MTAESHYLHSSHLEMLLEHLFAGEIMKRLWLAGVFQLEVLKPQVDDSGYDLVLEANSVVRHIQLKSAALTSRAPSVTLNAALGQKPSGCVVFIRFDASTFELGPFGFFGGSPGQPLPRLDDFRAARATRHNALGERPLRRNSVVLPLSKFERNLSVDTLIIRLFGARV